MQTDIFLKKYYTRKRNERGITMKKIMSMLLIMVILLTSVACGNETEEASQESNDLESKTEVQSNSDDQTSSNDSEIVDIVMEVINYGHDDQDLKMVEDAINKISEEKIGVHITLLTVPIANMATKLELMVAADEQMDIVQTGLLTTPNRLASVGLLLPITDYLSQEMKDLAGDLLKASTISGEVYAYPANLYPGTAMSLLYDKDLAKEYGIEIPKKINSPEDMEEIFQQVLDSGMEQYAISAGDGVNTEAVFGADYESLGDSAYNSYGVVLGANDNDEIINWYATDIYEQQSKYKYEWFEKGYLLPDSISNGYTVIDSMKQGTIFSYATPIGVGASVAYWSGQTGKNLEAVPISEVEINASGTINLSYGISANCENPQKAVDFLELLYTDEEVANIFNNGIEGKHYVKQEGSKIIKYPEGVDSMSAGYGSFIGPIGNASILYFREPFTDQFVENIDKYGLKEAKVSEYMGYVFDTEPVRSELASVNAVISQYSPSLSCGIINPNEILDEFIDGLSKAGMDKVIAENQKQLDAWLENNE